MKVLGIPVSDIKLGSTRTRYYYMLENLPDGWTYERYRPGLAGDVLYIQKTETDEVWDAIKDCKRRGIPIVYDRDDFCEPWEKKHTEIMDAVDAVTIITEGLLKHVQKHTKTKMYHVFDGIDYAIKRSDRAKIRKDISRVVTYGRWINIDAIAPYYKRISKKKLYITDRELKNVSGKYVPWNKSKFIRHVVKNDLVMIIHANNYRKKYKDVGRVMVAMALGLPVIASRCIEAERIFAEAGHPYLVVDNPKDAKAVMKRLSEYRARKRISDDLFEYAWSGWRPEQASKKMAEVFERVIHEKSIH